ncbi:SDR family oxidoreductase [Subtercola lobariae]|uniref:Oxidoreductase n=1 Tax=Subtercola lobariae TaxID=1588641 RepID=A0A917B1Y9_9MICO|nr:SDR family oxidoreductase [Subtercola lobariae]GGF15729.1 oxidoreductase [Subtercola lobariae]
MSGITAKVVAITGASSGIGEATALHLADEGARVIVAARREELVQALATRIRDAGGEAIAVQVDVREPADLRKLVSAALDNYGRLDVLFSNAGSMAVSALDDDSVDDWNEMIDVNLKGVLNGISAALPVFRRQKSGHFIHTASTSAHKVTATMSVYAATKTAVRALSEGLRQEAGPDLRVTVISPGFTNTEGVGKGGSPEVGAALRAQRDAMAMPPDAIAAAVAYAIAQPAGVEVGEIIIRPTAQG